MTNKYIQMIKEKLYLFSVILLRLNNVEATCLYKHKNIHVQKTTYMVQFQLLSIVFLLLLYRTVCHNISCFIAVRWELATFNVSILL